MGFVFTVIGGLIMCAVDLLRGFGIIGDSRVLAVIVGIICYLLFALGILSSLSKGEGVKGKMLGVLVNIGIWIALTIGVKMLIPFILVIVVLLLLDRFVFGNVIWDSLSQRFSSSKPSRNTVWPSMIFDSVSNDAYRINYSVSGNDYAVYNRSGDGREVVIYHGDVRRNNTARNHYGSFRW